MGRPALGLKYVQVGLREDQMDRLEALVGSGGRADFIRAAVDEALGREKNSIVPAGFPEADLEALRREGPGRVLLLDESPVAGVTKIVYPDGSARMRPAGRDFTDDFQKVLHALSDRTRAVRPLAVDLGWEQMRLERVLGKMADAGLVTFEGGVAARVV
jgi:hypothetical protein